MTVGHAQGWEFDEETVTEETIAALRSEAATAGDDEQAGLCDDALAGSVEAWRACVEAIRDARAQEES